MSRRAWWLPFAALFVLISSSFYWRRDIHAAVTDGSLSSLGDPRRRGGPWPAIPNLVHYVQLVPEDGGIHLKLLDYVSVLSAKYYFNPDAIYIHTDATPETVALAKGPNAPNKWAQKVLNLPSVKVNYVVAPEFAGNGVKILNLPNKSDFIRAQVGHEFGGVYFDFDVLPLRDFAPLRTMGFANVVGTEKYAMIGTGITLSVKGSELMRIWLKYEHVVYDGGWVTHAGVLLSTLVHRIGSIPYEVLTLDKQAFSPSSWEVHEVAELYGVHNETDPKEPRPDPTEGGRRLKAADLESFYQSKDVGPQDPWEFEYADSYSIHAFDKVLDEVETFPGMSVHYLMSRQSNLARAVYPVVKHAVDTGLLSLEDDEE